MGAPAVPHILDPPLVGLLISLYVITVGHLVAKSVEPRNGMSCPSNDLFCMFIIQIIVGPTACRGCFNII